MTRHPLNKHKHSQVEKWQAEGGKDEERVSSTPTRKSEQRRGMRGAQNKERNKKKKSSLLTEHTGQVLRREGERRADPYAKHFAAP